MIAQPIFLHGHPICKIFSFLFDVRATWSDLEGYLEDWNTKAEGLVMLPSDKHHMLCNILRLFRIGLSSLK